ncbi:VC0807 family protein [Streptomyces lydicus]|uniref:VC0807 family protein n=1 Tax=Streptomyces lydicus TaxID=47763 RepID=UPI001F51170B|nr:VC0807 family protein [Streptomyces lydicus]
MHRAIRGAAMNRIQGESESNSGSGRQRRKRHQSRDGGREAVDGTGPHPLVQSLTPLVVDAGIPLALYCLLSIGFGLSDVAALGWSSVVPALRTVWSLLRRTGVNALALLILVVNAVGLATSTVTGDPRLMLAKDGAVSSVIGIAVIVSVFLGKPLMTAGLKPFVTKGSAAGIAAWDRLMAGSAPFRGAERRFSLIWGTVLLVECMAKVIGAYTIPVHTMVWLGTVLMLVAILLAMVVAGGSCADPMEKMVKAEQERGADDSRGEAAARPTVAVSATAEG